MAKITEQAIAEIEINDKKAADKLRTLTGHAERLRAELSAIGKDDAAGLSRVTKELTLVEKEIKQTYAQALDLDKVLKDINGQSFNTLQKAQKSLTSQFKAGKISAEEYAAKITPINSRMQELQRTMRSGVVEQQGFFTRAQAGFNGLMGAVGRFLPIIGAAALAQKAFTKTMQATNDMADKFDVVMAGLKGGVDSFFRSVANGDWSNMLTNMQAAIKAAAEYTKAMDLIGDRQRSINLVTKENKRDSDLAALDAADQTKSIEERSAALEKSLDLLKQNLTLTKQIREEVATEEVKRVSEEYGIQEEQIRDIIRNYNEYSRIQENSDKSRFEYAKEILATQKELARVTDYLNSSDFARNLKGGGGEITNNLNKELTETKAKLEDFFSTVSGGDLIFAKAFGAYEHITEESLNKIKDSIGNVTDAESEYATAARRRTSQLSGFQNQTAKDAADRAEKAKQQELKAAEEAYEKEKLALAQQRAANETDDVTYKARLLTAEELFLQKKAAMQKAYGESSVKTEQQLAENRIKLIEKLSGKDGKVDMSKINADSEKLYQQFLASADAQLNAELEASQNFLDQENELRMDKYQEWMDMRQQLGIVGMQEQYLTEKRQLDTIREQEIISEEEYQQALLAIKIKYLQQYADKAQFLSQTLHNVVGGLEDLALSKSQVRKNKELAAAGDNAEERAAIEEKYAQEELDIQKKYADANFVLQTAQIIASTALAAMQAFSAMAGIPVVGPVLGAVAAAAAIAAGAIQIAAAKAARDQAKSATLSSSSSGGSKITSAGGYESGGYTGPGASNQPAGIVHRDEYVVPSVVMRNEPAAINHVRVLEAMRQSYYPGARRSTGFLEGGYVGRGEATSSPSSPSSDAESDTINLELVSVLSTLTSAVDTLNRKGAWVSYERGEKARTDADAVKSRATRR